MEKQNLIVCGCSFTKGHFLPETETWGGYVANKLNLTLHNIATGGMGNEWITQRTISYLENNPQFIDNSIVMIGWSDASRLMNSFERGDGYIDLVTVQPQDFDSGDFADHSRSHWGDDEFGYHGYVKKNYKYISRFYSSVAYCFWKTYYSIFLLKNYLESKKIPYIFFDAISKNKIVELKHIGDDPTDNKYSIQLESNNTREDSLLTELVPEWMINSFLNKNIEELTFNTPNYIEFDGKSMLKYMFDFGYERLTEGNPGHPNSIASELFSDIIIKEYDKLYNKR